LQEKDSGAGAGLKEDPAPATVFLQADGSLEKIVKVR
jgi:hypothetical protein